MCINPDSGGPHPTQRGPTATAPQTPTPRSNPKSHINADYESKCNRLKITYSDANVDSDWKDFDIDNKANPSAFTTALDGIDQRCTIT